MTGARTTRYAALTILACSADFAGCTGPIPVEPISRPERALRMAVGGKTAQVVLLTNAGRRA